MRYKHCFLACSSLDKSVNSNSSSDSLKRSIQLSVLSSQSSTCASSVSNVTPIYVIEENLTSKVQSNTMSIVSVACSSLDKSFNSNSQSKTVREDKVNRFNHSTSHKLFQIHNISAFRKFFEILNYLTFHIQFVQFAQVFRDI